MSTGASSDGGGARVLIDPTTIAITLDDTGGTSDDRRVLIDPTTIAVTLDDTTTPAGGATDDRRVLIDPTTIAVTLDSTTTASTPSNGDATDDRRVLVDPTTIAVTLTATTNDGEATMEGARGSYRTLADLGLAPPSSTTPEASQLFRIIHAVAGTDAAGYGRVVRDPVEGIRVGLMLVPLGAGVLGEVLRLTRDRDPESFRSTFAPDADGLYDTATAATRTARLGAVGGAQLWDELWTKSFADAASLDAFRNAQNEHAVEQIARPLVPVAQAYGIFDGAAFAVVLDRAMHHGVAGAIEWLDTHLSPFSDDAKRRAGLAQLGYDTWDQLQAATPWLTPTGRDDILTRAALVGALRRSGALADQPAPLDVLVHAADDEQHVRRLAGVEGLSSISLGVTNAE